VPARRGRRGACASGQSERARLAERDDDDRRRRSSRREALAQLLSRGRGVVEAGCVSRFVAVDLDQIRPGVDRRGQRRPVLVHGDARAAETSRSAWPSLYERSCAIGAWF
jgi:hypothetical protein